MYATLVSKSKILDFFDLLSSFEGLQKVKSPYHLDSGNYIIFYFSNISETEEIYLSSFESLWV